MWCATEEASDGEDVDFFVDDLNEEALADVARVIADDSPFLGSLILYDAFSRKSTNLTICILHILHAQANTSTKKKVRASRPTAITG
jgi:hypothetical protein